MKTEPNGVKPADARFDERPEERSDERSGGPTAERPSGHNDGRSAERPEVRPDVAVGSAKALRALGSASRQEIVDALTSRGPSTISELATLLGRRADGLYFHVRALLRAGLLVEREPVDVHGRATAVYDVPGTIRLDYAGGARRELARVVRQALRLAEREFDRACQAGIDAGDGGTRTLWGGRVMGWVSDEELARVNALITELHVLLRRGRPGEGRRAISVGFLLAPAGFGERKRASEKKESE